MVGNLGGEDGQYECRLKFRLTLSSYSRTWYAPHSRVRRQQDGVYYCIMPARSQLPPSLCVPHQKICIAIAIGISIAILESQLRLVKSAGPLARRLEAATCQKVCPPKSGRATIHIALSVPSSTWNYGITTPTSTHPYQYTREAYVKFQQGSLYSFDRESSSYPSRAWSLCSGILNLRHQPVIQA